LNLNSGLINDAGSRLEVKWRLASRNEKSLKIFGFFCRLKKQSRRCFRGKREIGNDLKLNMFVGLKENFGKTASETLMILQIPRVIEGNFHGHLSANFGGLQLFKFKRSSSYQANQKTEQNQARF
jgi:hypothetical protein